MSFSPKQRVIVHANNTDQAKIQILEGAVRSGKTHINNWFWVRHVWGFRGRGVDFILTGHTVSSVERNVLVPLSETFGFDTKMDQHNSFRMFGNRCHVFGADNADAYKPITGMTAFGWYGNEISLQHENTRQTCFERCSGEGARIFWDTNPDYPEHPVKTQYIDRDGDRLSTGRLHIRSWHFVLEDNPFLSPDYVESLKRTTPAGMWYDRAINGLWVAAEGLVYPEWDRNPGGNVIEPFPIPTEWPRYRGIDLGYENPFVCLWAALDPDKRLYIYDEHYEAGKLLEYHAAQIKRRLEPVVRTVADHDAQEVAELSRYGVYSSPAKKDVLLGIQRVATRIKKQPDGKPRLFVMRNCTNTVREMGHYRWLKKKAA